MLQMNNAQLNLKLGATKANLLRVTSQHNVCIGKLSKAISECNDLSVKCDQLQIELMQQTNLAKAKESEIVKISKEIVQLTKEKDAAQKRTFNAEQQKTEIEKKSVDLRWEILENGIRRKN